MRSSLVGRVSLPGHVAAAAALAVVLSGCASAPGTLRQRVPSNDSGAAATDGPGANPPADLASRADAEPRVEPIRSGGANKPYQVLGRSYVPETRDAPFRERGLASWYGRKFHGRKTASGEVYDMYAMTAAHPTLPIPSYARIRNPANGREVVVRINDRGPFVAGRIVDLSYTAALKLDLLRGVAPVELERLTFDDIRTGAWRGGATRRDPGEPAPVAVATATTVPADHVALVALVAAAPVEAAAPPPATAAGFWIQLGAFRQREGAESFRRRVGADAEAGWLEPSLAIVGDGALHRVQAGPYRSRDEAESVAQRVRAALQVVPVVVERH
ncbi:MAG: septal ring lytic transglycosylase RlpA family protein [Caldimonas sp.]